MIRQCMRDRYPTGSLGVRASQMFCPVCSLRERALRRVRAGERLFANLTGQGVSARMWGTPRNMGYEKAERLRARSLRRGAVRSILAPVGSLVQLLKAGQGHSSARRLLLDLGAKKAAAMARVLIEASDDGGRTRGGRGKREFPRPIVYAFGIRSEGKRLGVRRIQISPNSLSPRDFARRRTLSRLSSTFR